MENAMDTDKDYYYYADKALAGCLPKDFDMWTLQNQTGNTIAHIAAIVGKLPDTFDKWSMSDVKGYSVAHVAARYGNLPDGFEQWDMRTKTGNTVAHEAALGGHLPPDFNGWRSTNFMDWNVAVTAAQAGHLPDTFNEWWLLSPHGKTVAHIAALHSGGLPANFDSWDLTEEKALRIGGHCWSGHYPRAIGELGWTVAHEAAKNGHLPDNFDQWSLATDKHGPIIQYLSATNKEHFLMKWENEEPLYRTEEDWAIFKENFPEIYNKYTLNEESWLRS
jgi:hypothetical protein